MADDNLKINARIDSAKIAELRAILSPENVPRAVSAAVNKTLGKLKTRTNRAVRDVLVVSRDDVNEKLFVKKASASDLSGYVRVSRKPVPLSKYNPRQTKVGVYVTIRKGRGKELVKPKPGQGVGMPFLARMKSGHIGVFNRKPGWKHVLADVENGRRMFHGLPIFELYGPTVVGVIAGSPGVLQKLEDFANEDVSRQIDSQIDRFLEKQLPDLSEPSDAE